MRLDHLLSKENCLEHYALNDNPNGRFFQRTQVRREIIRVVRLKPRDRQLIGTSCCLVLRDQMIEARSSIVEVRMKIRFESRELRSSIKWNLTHIGLSRKSRNAGLVNPYIFDWLDPDG